MGLTTKPLLFALGVSVLLLAGSGYLLKKEIKQHARTQAALETTTASLTSFKLASEQLVKDQIAISKESLRHQNNYTKATRELSKLKNREATVLRKKGLVELKINKAFNKQQARLACVAGDSTACGS